MLRLISSRLPKTVKSANYQVTKRNFTDASTTFGIITEVAKYGTLMTIAGGGSLAAFGAYRYKVSAADEYLVRTGLGIKDIKITKQGFIWPFQKYKFIRMNPKNYSFDLCAMSSELISFVLSGVFTIGPVNDPEGQERYVRTVVSLQESEISNCMESVIMGIFEGSTSLFASQMTLNDIFNNRVKFKERIIEDVKDKLYSLGMTVINSSIRSLKNEGDSKDFYNIS